MIITSTSLNVHTFLKIATATTGIICTIDVLYICIYVYRGEAIFMRELIPQLFYQNYLTISASFGVQRVL